MVKTMSRAGLLIIAVVCSLYVSMVPAFAQTGSAAAVGSSEPAASATEPAAAATEPAATATASVTIEGLLKAESIGENSAFAKKLGDFEKKEAGGFSGKDLTDLFKSQLKRLVVMTADKSYVLIFADRKVNRKLSKHAGAQIRCVGTPEPVEEGKTEQRFRVTDWTLIDDAGKPIEAGSGSGSH